MVVNITLGIPCERRSLGEAAEIIKTLIALYPDNDLPEEPAGVLPDQSPTTPQAGVGDPAEHVESWFSHIGSGGRKFWRIDAEYALNNHEFAFDDLAAGSGIAKETLRSYHRNSYRAVKDEHAPDPMVGKWDAQAKRAVYSILPAVRDKILELTESDPT